MRINYLLSSALLMLPVSLIAQDDATTPTPPPASDWKTELQAGVNLNQSSFSDNWKAGGVNSVAVSAFLNGKAELKKEKYEWINDLQLLYGNIKNKDQGLRKNADRIFFDSKFAYKLTKSWNAFAAVNFQSQFGEGYEYASVQKVSGGDSATRISGFLSPAYLTEAIGMEWKPVTYFSAQFGVGALRQTFVTDQTLYAIKGATELYGVPIGDNMRNQVVFQFVANFDKEIMKNITLKSRYLALADYQKLNGQGIVHRLDANLIAKVNRFVNVNLAGVVLYDYDQDHDVQYSQVLSIGILYTFSNGK